jgi:uncharacterized membrane protein
MQEFLLINKEYITILHVLSVVIGMGGAIITDFLFVYFALNKKLSFTEIKIIKLLSGVVLYALVAIIITGIFIFLSNPEKYLVSAKFLTKMTIVSTLTINGILLHVLVFKHLKDDGYLTKFKNRNLRRLAFGFGSISITSWLCAMSLGVLDKISITYTSAISIYFFIIILAIITSQLIYKAYENRKF